MVRKPETAWVFGQVSKCKTPPRLQTTNIKVHSTQPISKNLATWQIEDPSGLGKRRKKNISFDPYLGWGLATFRFSDGHFKRESPWCRPSGIVLLVRVVGNARARPVTSKGGWAGLKGQASPFSPEETKEENQLRLFFSSGSFQFSFPASLAPAIEILDRKPRHPSRRELVGV